MADATACKQKESSLAAWRQTLHLHADAPAAAAHVTTLDSVATNGWHEWDCDTYLNVTIM